MCAKNVTNFLRFCYLNIPCLRMNITFIFMNSSSDVFTILKENSKTDAFFGFRPSYLCPSKGHQDGVSIQSLRKNFPEYLVYVISQRPHFWRSFFVYLSSFVSQIVDFLN